MYVANPINTCAESNPTQYLGFVDKPNHVGNYSLRQFPSTFGFISQYFHTPHFWDVLPKVLKPKCRNTLR